MDGTEATLAATSSAEEEIKSRQERESGKRGVEGTAAKEELSGGEVGSGGGQR